MSDNRKILDAKRRNERDKMGSFVNNRLKNIQESSNIIKKGTKRPIIPTQKKNLANDRLKKLRTNLLDEVQKQSIKTVNVVKTSSVQQKLARKRPQTAESKDVTIPKVPRTSVSQSIFTKSDGACEPTSNIFNANLQSCPSSQNVDNDNEEMEWTPVLPADEVEPTTSKLDSSNSIFIVVDTNIFISQLSLVRSIVNMDITDCKKPIIFIPWMVIEELDFIKEDTNKGSLKWKAQEAIKYIENTLSSNNERLRGQTLNEVTEQKDSGKNQDNKIIGCCVQLLEKKLNMILLTDDINLRNKAHINNIPVCSNKEIMARIALSSGNTKSQLIERKMKSLCSDVINECALKAYGETCYRMPICRNKPKSLQDCLKVFTKYWFPVFQEYLMKQFKKSVEDLSTFLTSHGSINDDSNELNELVRLCVRLCVFLKDVESCKSMTECTIRDLNNIKES